MLELDYNTFLASIKDRHSCRRYKTSIETTKMVALEQYISVFTPLSSGRIVVCHKGFSSCLKDHSEHITPVDQGLLFIGEDKEEAYIGLGHLGEKAILGATALGIGTCWVAGSYSNSAASTLTDLKKNEKILAVSPLGYEASRSDLTYYLDSRVKNRKLVREFVKSDDPTLYSFFELIRLAPSALNRQTWSFTCEKKTISAGIVDNAPLPISYFDQGIAMFHLEVALNLAGYKVCFINEEGTWKIHLH